ncbi:formyl transferase [Trichoderma barbatum]
MSISPSPLFGSPDLRDLSDVPHDVATADTDDGMSMDSSEGSPITMRNSKALQQPIFQQAPRFKPLDAENTFGGLPVAFSPQKRGARYVPGGMAAQVQGWLSEIKGWEENIGKTELVMKIHVDQIRSGRRMYLVEGRDPSADASKKWILAGEGKLTGLGKRAEVKNGSVVVSDPLRILFCGSDAFSCESLRALHQEHERNAKLIESLDVMVLPPRRTGRGFKDIKEVPCKSVAEHLGLRIHQRETFRGWNTPEGTNLIVVVSFGLFVPPRILNSAKYGGLNVHPSLLPHLRGPAPIHHAMMRGDGYTGVSLQTLDPKAFDHGIVLSQTPSPGLPIPAGATLQGFTESLANVGAEMLVQGLRDGLHVPPYTDAGWMAKQLKDDGLDHAPKVGKGESQISWSEWTTSHFERFVNIFKTVWTHARNDKGKFKRVLFLDAQSVPAHEVTGRNEEIVFRFEVGNEGRDFPMTVRVDDERDAFYVQTAHEGWVRVKSVKVDGKTTQTARIGMREFMKKMK